MDDAMITVAMRHLAKKPESKRFFRKIGYPAVFKMGCG